MKVHSIVVPPKPYQRVILPNGAAPVAVLPNTVLSATRFEIFFIGPDEIKPETSTVFGLFVTRTGEALPEDVVLFPIKHVLLNQVTQPNARYVGTVDGRHVFLGNPRQESAS